MSVVGKKSSPFLFSRQLPDASSCGGRRRSLPSACFSRTARETMVKCCFTFTAFVIAKTRPFRTENTAQRAALGGAQYVADVVLGPCFVSTLSHLFRDRRAWRRGRAAPASAFARRRAGGSGSMGRRPAQPRGRAHIARRINSQRGSHQQQHANFLNARPCPDRARGVPTSQTRGRVCATDAEASGFRRHQVQISSTPPGRPRTLGTGARAGNGASRGALRCCLDVISLGPSGAVV